MVISKPTNKITAAAIGLFPSNKLAPLLTKLCISPVDCITDAKPCADIMIKPIMAIMATPLLNTSPFSSHLTIPNRLKIITPTKPPSIIEPLIFCAINEVITAKEPTNMTFFGFFIGSWLLWLVTVIDL